MPPTPRPRLLAAAAAAALSLAAAPASATWSIILVDTRTGEVGVASATCLTTFDLQKWTPVLLTGVGAVTAQASVNGEQFANRTIIRDRLGDGAAPVMIIGALAAADPFHSSRQYGLVDVLGRRGTFTGPQAQQWAGGATGTFQYTYEGQTGTIVYAIQGNILTGAPVVQLAALAARDTPGDLPQRLMAAMEAARAAGGDGRCSCPTGPTSCGAPPPSFEKSAHIGYMLVARAGDTDGSHGYYRTGTTPRAIALADLTGDGRPDLAAANADSGSAALLQNLTEPGAPFPRLSAPAPFPVGASPRGIAAADFTGDGIPDLLTTNTVGSSFSLLPGLGGGAFGPAATTAVVGRPTALAVADFDGQGGPDLVFIDETTAAVSIYLNDGAGVLGLSASLTGDGGHRDIAVGDVNGDGIADIVVAAGGASRLLVFLGNGAGGFAPPVPIPTLATPHAVAAADFNGDGALDLAVVHQSTPPALSILLNDGSGGFSAATHTLPATPQHVAAGDITGDGHVDLVIPVTGGRFLTYHGSAVGVFAAAGDFDLTTDFAGAGVTRVALADMDGDGDLDAVFAVGPYNSVAIAENRGGGSFFDRAGTASGDYFMSFNVPNQPAGAPDPVFQLQAMFDDWRDGLIGRPDAVQSLVAVPTLIAGSSNTGVMTVTLRDWQGGPVTVPLSSFTVARASAEPAHVDILGVGNPSPGVYEVTLAALDSVASNRLVITTNDGLRPVTLMPRPVVTVAMCPADWDQDGVVNSGDIVAFLQAWLASIQDGTLQADFTGDGVVNSADITAFLTRWIAAAAGSC